MTKRAWLVSLPATALLMAAANGAWLKKVPAADHAMVNPVASQPDAITAGSNLYKNNCAQCHGADGNGRGSRPPLHSARIAGASDGDLYWLLKNGQPFRGMPSWARLPEGQRWQIVSYLRSIQQTASTTAPGVPSEEYPSEIALSRPRGACRLRAPYRDRRCGSAGDAPDPTPDADVTPPADSIGERIFLDTRFSEYLATHMTGVNDPLAVSRGRHRAHYERLAARSLRRPDHDADLGLCNVYLNPDMPNPQSALKGVVSAVDCSVGQGLASTIAQFKTLVLRDLADSTQYFHNGAALDRDALVAFLISLTEDYDGA